MPFAQAVDGRIGDLTEILAGKPPAVIIADGVDPPALLVESCVHAGVPVFRTKTLAAGVIDMLRSAQTNVASEEQP